MKAVVDDINKRGGLLGRKIVLVPHDYNTAATVNDAARPSAVAARISLCGRTVGQCLKTFALTNKRAQLVEPRPRPRADRVR